MNAVSARILHRWATLTRSARLFLLHTGLLTASLAITGLFYNLTVLALGYPVTFIGTLDTLSIGTAAASSLPLWWLAARIGPRASLIIAALLQAAAIGVVAIMPTTAAFLISATLLGFAATLYGVSSAPFMMRHSDSRTRDHVFSANQAIAIGIGGVSSLLAGGLPARFGAWLDVGAESVVAYRATFGVAATGLLLAVIPMLLIRTDRAPAETSQAAEKHASPLSIRLIVRTIRWMISPLFISLGAAMLIPYLNVFFKLRFTIANETLGVIFAVLGIATGVATLLAPLLSQRIGKVRTVVLAQMLSIPFLMTLGFVPVLVIAVGAELIRRSLFNMVIPLYNAFALEHFDDAERPTVIGLISGVSSVGYIVAPTISTRIQQDYGFGPLFIITVVCYSLAIVANAALFLRHGARRAGPM